MIKSDENILDAFILKLDGKLPYMTKKEKNKFLDFNREIENNYKKITDCFQSGEKKDYLLELIEDYITSITCQNSLLNDLYYKNGIRLCGKLYKQIQGNFTFIN